MKWLTELEEWYGEPKISVDPEKKMRNQHGDERFTRLWVWFPIKGTCNHNVRIERAGDSRYHIRIGKHGLRNHWAFTEVTLIHYGEPSDDLMRDLLKVVEFRDYRGELD